MMNSGQLVGGIFIMRKCINTINYTNTISRYSGSITDSSGRSIAHISIIPPDYKTRSAFLAQQVFPSLSPIIKNIMSNSLCFELTNMPFLILNLNEDNPSRKLLTSKH